MVKFPNIFSHRFFVRSSTLLIGSGFTVSLGVGLYTRVKIGPQKFHNQVICEIFEQLLAKEYQSGRSFIMGKIHLWNAELLKNRATALIVLGGLKAFRFCFKSLTYQEERDFLTHYTSNVVQFFMKLFQGRRLKEIEHYLRAMEKPRRQEIYRELFEKNKIDLLTYCLEVVENHSLELLPDETQSNQYAVQLFEKLFKGGHLQEIERYLRAMEKPRRQEVYRELFNKNEIKLLVYCHKVVERYSLGWLPNEQQASQYAVQLFEKLFGHLQEIERYLRAMEKPRRQEVYRELFNKNEIELLVYCHKVVEGYSLGWLSDETQSSQYAVQLFEKLSKEGHLQEIEHYLREMEKPRRQEVYRELFNKNKIELLVYCHKVVERYSLGWLPNEQQASQYAVQLFEKLSKEDHLQEIEHYLRLMGKPRRQEIYRELFNKNEIKLLAYCHKIVERYSLGWLSNEKQASQYAVQLFEKLSKEGHLQEIEHYLKEMEKPRRQEVYRELFNKNEIKLLAYCHKVVERYSLDWLSDEKQLNQLESLSARYPYLCKYGRDLTREISLGRVLNPFFGREKEIIEIGASLNQRLKTFPVLVGDAGVGKTSVVEEIARRIAYGESVPSSLQGRRIFILSLEALEAGEGYSDKGVQRLTNILSEINRRESEIIIFVDEVHAFFAKYGNILKPALAAGNLKGIGATTPEEYRQMVKDDPPLKRRLPIIVFKEPTPASTLGMLRALHFSVEQKYKLEVEDGALLKAVDLAEKYMKGRRFPDKAIDVLDTACSRKASSFDLGHWIIRDEKEELLAVQEKIRERELKGVPPEDAELNKLKEKEKELTFKLRELEGKREALCLTIPETLERQREIIFYKKLASVREGVPKALSTIEGKIKKLQRKIHIVQGEKQPDFVVNASEIETTVAEMTGLPIDRLSGDEKSRLLGLAERLKKTIIGQDGVVEVLSQGIIRARLNLSHPNRPKGVFFFMGQTGVGKTELAKRLAEDLFGSKDAVIRFDMTEFQHGTDVPKLIGSPPGYHGNAEGGRLTNRLIERPHSIVLLDEFEKADLSVSRLFYQVFDDGRLTDGRGVTVSCQDAIFIMTSNLGFSRSIRRSYSMARGAEKYLNQDFQGKDEACKDSYTRQEATEILQGYFGDAFCNRIDEVCVFKELDKESIKKICQLRISEYTSRVFKNSKVHLTLTEEVFNYFVTKGWVPQFGGRPLERLIDRELGNLIAPALLEGRLTENMRAHFKMESNSLQIECLPPVQKK